MTGSLHVLSALSEALTPLKHTGPWETLFPYCCWSLWWISADRTFSPKRNLITMRCPTPRGNFCSLITPATPRQDWTGGRVEVVASLSQGRTAAAQCGLFTHKSVPVIFEPPCKFIWKVLKLWSTITNFLVNTKQDYHSLEMADHFALHHEHLFARKRIRAQILQLVGLSITEHIITHSAECKFSPIPTSVA
jgi:hypothetical protein